MKALFDSFELRSREVQTKLEIILQTIQAGKVPSEAVCAETGTALSQLRETYNDVRTEVAEHMLSEEIPEGEAPVSEYRIAWESSIKRRNESTLAILNEFLLVYSEEERYMKALERPFAEAEALLHDLKGGTGNEVDAKSYELFLKGIKTDLSSDQELVYQIEDDLEDKFPSRAISGLIQNKYAIRPLEEEHDKDLEEPSSSIEAESSDDPQEEQPVINSDEFSEEVIDMTQKEFATRYVPLVEEGEEAEKTEEQQSDADQLFDFSELNLGDDDFDFEEEEFIEAINTPSVPSKLPSDPKFKEIANYAGKVLRYLIDQLPFSGFVDVEDLYIPLGAYDDAQYRKRVNAMIDHLESKGFIYRYNINERTIICFTEYAQRCLQKKSIADYVKRRFGLSRICSLYMIGEPKMPLSILEDHFPQYNYIMQIIHFVSAKDELSKVFPSFSWRNDSGYFVAKMKTPDGSEIHLQATHEMFIDKLPPAEGEGVICCANALPNMDRVTDDVRYCIVDMNLYQYKADQKAWVCIVGDKDDPEDDKTAKEATAEIDQQEAYDSVEEMEVSPEAQPEPAKARNQPGKTEDRGNKTAEKMGENMPSITPDKLERESEEIERVDLENLEFKEKVSEFCQMALEGDWVINDKLMASMILKLLEEERLHPDNNEPWVELSQALLLAKSAASDPANEGSGLLYEQLLLATDVEMDFHEYTGDRLMELFAIPSKATQAIMLAAYCLAMFAPAHSYDYSLKSAVQAAESDYDELFPAFEATKPVFHRLTKVWDVIPEGFTDSILDKLSDHAEGMANLEKMKQSAKHLLEEPTIKAKMSGLPELCSACFGPRSDMREAVEIVAENRRNDQEFVEALLSEYCVEEGDGYELSDEKIENTIDKEWKKATKGKRTNRMTLAMLARDQVKQAFVDRLELFKSWVEYNSNVDEKRIPEIRKLAHQLSVDIKEALDALAEVDAIDKPAIVQWMLITIRDRLEAKARTQKLFVDLLQTGVVSVDLDGYPIIRASFNQVPFYEPWRLAVGHIGAQREDLKAVARDIVKGKPPYGDNLRQLEMIGKYLHDDSDLFVVSTQQRLEAQRSAVAETEEFKNKLEIAYTYNRIEETDKENLLALINNYRDIFFEIGDYANWQRFIKALEKQIDAIASKRKESLRIALAACYDSLGEDEESTLLDEARKLLVEKENFAVTEEYINRFRNGDRDLSAELSYAMHEPDSFAEFAREEVFQPLYDECLRAKGRNFSRRGQSYLIEHFPSMWTQRLKDDSTRLLKNWPTGQGSVSASQIADLFRGLGLNVKDAWKVESQRNEQYQLNIENMERNMPDYRHPIAIFGTQAISPMNVVVFQGSIMARELVDTMARLNLGSMSIVLINYPVTMAYRREVAELFHKGTIGHSSFLLLDQTLILHLALHQDTERLPILLKCTLPFTGYQPFLRDGGPTADEMFCGRVEELSTIIDPNGASVVYGGRQLGKTALLERAESLTLKPDKKAFAAYCSIYELTTEKDVVEKILHDARIKPYMEQFNLADCTTIQALCDQFNRLMSSGKMNSFLLLIDEADAFLHAISDNKYEQIRPLVELKRSTRNRFKFVLAGLHNVCRAKNATADNGIFGQLGQPLCVKPLSPTDALQLISRPLRYLGFQVEMYPHLETILTNTNYYPGILQFFGYTLVQNLPSQYGKYYRANQGNPPFSLEEKQLGEIMNSSDLNNSIRSKFRWSLELDKRYFMLARCITLLYYGNQGDPMAERAGYAVDDIMKEAAEWDIHCLENTSKAEFGNLLDEMVSMGILSCIGEGTQRYRLRRHSFINIIGSDMDKVLDDIAEDNAEVSA